MDKQQIKAVLFDYDGVIADTMEDNFRAWRCAFRQQGVTLGKNEYMELEGMSPQDIVKTLGSKHSINPALYWQIMILKEDFYQKNNNFRLYPGVLELLTKLKQANLNLALVSGAAQKRLKSLTPQAVLVLFDAVVCADNAEESKPHPAPYRKALELLGVCPEQAVVIENAPLGIKSAKEAGLYCIAVCSTLPENKLREADLVCSTLGEVSNIIFPQLRSRETQGIRTAKSAVA